MKQIILTKGQIKKINEIAEINTTTGTKPTLPINKKNGQVTSDSQSNYDYAMSNQDNVNVVVNNLDVTDKDAPTVMASSVEQAVNDLKSPFGTSTYYAQKQGLQEGTVEYDKSHVEKLRLEEIKKNGVVMTKNELSEFLRN